jgi:rhodanese-related sulfurtransferase
MKTTKRFFQYILLVAVVSSTLFSSCKKEEDEFDAQAALTEYLVAENLDLNTIIQGFVMDTPDDVSKVSEMYIIDIRSAAEFAQGHIANAHRADMKDILTEAAKAASGQQILVVCKSGQTATYASTLLRLAGYPTAKALKWGMSRWHASLDVWTTNIGNVAQDHANWTTDAAPTNLTYSAPKFSSSHTDPQSILMERVEKVLAEGYKSVQPATVLATPDSYFINNFFPEADYVSFGHIKGANRINPLLIGEGQVLFLDPSKEIVTYCYTGQTSGAITAYLRVLGYNATSMMWGMNNLYNSHASWVSNKWSAGMIKNLPVVTD